MLRWLHHSSGLHPNTVNWDLTFSTTPWIHLHVNIGTFPSIVELKRLGGSALQMWSSLLQETSGRKTTFIYHISCNTVYFMSSFCFSKQQLFKVWEIQTGTWYSARNHTHSCTDLYTQISFSFLHSTGLHLSIRLDFNVLSARLQWSQLWRKKYSDLLLNTFKLSLPHFIYCWAASAIIILYSEWII